MRIRRRRNPHWSFTRLALGSLSIAWLVTAPLPADLQEVLDGLRRIAAEWVV